MDCVTGLCSPMKMTQNEKSAAMNSPCRKSLATSNQGQSKYRDSSSRGTGMEHKTLLVSFPDPNLLNGVGNSENEAWE